MPIAVVKKRVQKGVPSFEIRWKDTHGILCNVECVEDLLVTVEPQEMFRTAYPDLVEEYVKEKEAKSRKGEQCYTSFTVFILQHLVPSVSFWWLMYYLSARNGSGSYLPAS
jgi:hypothetical protein